MGLAASEPWLIELPWCSQTRRPSRRRGSTGASVRRATSSVVSLCGSQISTSLIPAGQAREPEGAGRAGPRARRSRSPCRWSSGVAAGRAGLAGQTAVDEQVVHAVRAGRARRRRPAWWAATSSSTAVAAGAERQPYAGGLGLGHGELRVGALGAGPGGQPVRQHAVRGALQVEGAAQQVGGDRRGDPGRLGRAASCGGPVAQQGVEGVQDPGPGLLRVGGAVAEASRPAPG